MKKNMGAFDRTLRILLAIIMGALIFAHTVTGTLSIVLLILVIVFLLTSLVSFCPLYAFFGITTCKTKQKEA
jgi:Inner membrane protein YgaP-like, transmembrane domain